MTPIRPGEHVAFDPEKMSKVALAAGAQMMVGLNCFLPGQEHSVHTHPGQDKLYHVLEGAGTFVVGDEAGILAGPGDVVFVPGGVPHGARNTGTESLIVMVVLAPPPAPRT